MQCSVELDFNLEHTSNAYQTNFYRQIKQATRDFYARADATANEPKQQQSITMPGGSLYTPRTKEQLTGEFQPLVPPIQNEITLKELIRIWQHCRCCAQHTETNFDPQNYLYIVMNNLLLSLIHI